MILFSGSEERPKGKDGPALSFIQHWQGARATLHTVRQWLAELCPSPSSDFVGLSWWRTQPREVNPQVWEVSTFSRWLLVEEQAAVTTCEGGSCSRKGQCRSQQLVSGLAALSVFSFTVLMTFRTQQSQVEDRKPEFLFLCVCVCVFFSL